MKILHTGDLHIGKYVHDFSMLEDQSYILKQIQEIAIREKADVMLLAGDIYDRSVPMAEAVAILDDFLTEVLAAGIRILMISGNHDSPERVEFASRILEKQGLYITGTYEETKKWVTLKDDYGEVAFLCIPFCRPGTRGAHSCEEMVAEMLADAQIDTTKRNVLLSHYFVTDSGRTPLLSDSETMVHVGGLDNVEASLLEAFDYVALGHIHRPQQIGDRPVYYAGSPLKYSFSEAMHDKSVNIVTLGEKGDITVTREKLKPLREMRVLKGNLEQILEAAGGKKDMDYVQITLTDEVELYDPMGTLRSVYPNVMQLLFTGREEGAGDRESTMQADRARSPLQMYQDFYEEVRGKEMDEERLRIVEEIMKAVETELA